MKKITLLIIALCFMVQFVNAQDTCATALPISGAGFYVVTTVNGTQVPTPVCASNGPITGTNARGEWYTYTPTQNHSITITTDISQNTPRIDTRFHVYTGMCSALSCYNGDDDSGANYSSIATFDVFANTTYIIAWDNKWSSNGFTFQLTENPYVAPPPTPVNYITQNIATVNSSFNNCVVDMNGDHKDDIVGVSANNLKINFQGTAGALTPTTIAITGTSLMPTWSIAAGDYNKDGYNDLLLGNGSGLTFWKSNSTGTAYTSITPGEYIFCQRTNFVDINNDGNLDAFSCHDIAPNVYYINNGSGQFAYHQSGTSGAYSLGVTSSGGNYASLWTDFDNDGDLDMFISKCSGPPCELHRNDGNGIFTDISALAQINITPIQSWSSAIADFDNDGDMDILIGSNGGTPNKFFRNNLDTSNTTEEAFSNITAGSGWDSNNSINRDYVAYDFDNNGLVDVLGSGNKIMFNLGNNVFSPVTYPAGIAVGAVGDLNDDGFLDILNGSTVKYAVPNANNWLKVTLNGIVSNSNGIGARVEIYGAFGKQIRDIRSGEGFEYMSSLNAHFGLGTATAITQLIVRWPSGTVDVINNPDINSKINVIEGSQALGSNSFINAQFSLYPNPAKSILNIKSNDTITLKSAQIYDINGNLVIKSEIINNAINVENIATGTYVLLLTDSEGKGYSQKFIKK